MKMRRRRLLFAIFAINIIVFLYFLSQTLMITHSEAEREIVSRIMKEEIVDTEVIKDYAYKAARDQYHNAEYAEVIITDNTLGAPVQVNIYKDFGLKQDKHEKGDDQDQEIDGINMIGSDFNMVSHNVYVYSAYFDDRNGRFIRLVSIAKFDASERGWLQCLFLNGNVITNATFLVSSETHSLPYAAYLVSCPVPDSIQVEDLMRRGVELLGVDKSSKRLSTGIGIEIPKMDNTEHNFEVCVPPLFGSIEPTRIVEFIEVTKILGANHFTFYQHSVNDDAIAVLESYDKNEVTLLPWEHGFGEDQIWYKGQSASIWDCLIRNMYRGEYIAFNDIDEFIVPKIATNWGTMIKYLNRNGNKNIASYKFMSINFDNSKVDKDPKFSRKTRKFQTLNTVMRTKDVDFARSKQIVDPKKVLELGIHHLAKTIDSKHDFLLVKPSIGILHHYRKFETPIIKKNHAHLFQKPKMIEDLTMWNYYGNITNAIGNKTKLLQQRGLSFE